MPALRPAALTLVGFLAANLAAQGPTIQAFALSDLAACAGTPGNVSCDVASAGTDVTAGSWLVAGSIVWFDFQSSEVRVETSQSPVEGVVLEITERSTLINSPGSVIFTGNPGGNRILAVISSPVEVSGILEVSNGEYGWIEGDAIGAVDVGADGTEEYLCDGAAGCGPLLLPVTVGPDQPLELVTRCETGQTTGNGRVHLDIRFRPRACTAEIFGAMNPLTPLGPPPCGDVPLLHESRFEGLELTIPNVPTNELPFLVFGFASTPGFVLPVAPSCELRVAPHVIVPVVPDPAGLASLLLDVPQNSGFGLQALSVDFVANTVRTSVGVTLSCE